MPRPLWPAPCAQTAQMIKTAAQPPRESIAYIEKAINQYARLPEDPKVQEFGMDMSSRPMEARGRSCLQSALCACMLCMPRLMVPCTLLMCVLQACMLLRQPAR